MSDLYTVKNSQGMSNFTPIGSVYLGCDIFMKKQTVNAITSSSYSRLGRLRAGGAKGPGLFFIMPCIDSYKKVDLRTVSFDVPPQEVCQALTPYTMSLIIL